MLERTMKAHKLPFEWRDFLYISVLVLEFVPFETAARSLVLGFTVLYYDELISISALQRIFYESLTLVNITQQRILGLCKVKIRP